MAVAEKVPGGKAAIRTKNALLHNWSKKKIAGVGAAAGILAAVLAGGNEHSVTQITKPGKATIDSLTLTPGKYCNAIAEVNMQDVATRYTHFIGKVVFGQHIGVHAWTQESMSGELEAQVCVLTKHKHKATRQGSHYDLQLTASADPKKSDFTLIIYPKDPTQMTYTPDNSNIEKISDATLGNIENDLNLIPGVNLHGKATIQDRLKAIDLLQGYNNLSRQCGVKIVKRLTAAQLPGGNMETLMEKDMIQNTPGAAGVVKPTDIHFLPVQSDGTGLPNQYSTPGVGENATSVFADVEKNNQGLSFPTSGMPACGDLAKAVSHAS